MSALRPLIISAFFLVLSLLFTILACTVTAKRNGWPFMSFMLYCLTLVPFYLCGGMASSMDDFEGPSGAYVFHTLGLFLGGGLLVSGPGLAIVLYHTNIITGTALALSLASALCFLITRVTLAMQSQPQDEDGYDF